MELRNYEFFHRATTEICRHLRIENALHACARLLSSYMPIETMYLDVLDSDADVVRTIASATLDSGTAMDRLVNYPEVADGPVFKLVDDEQEANHFISNRPGNHPWLVAVWDAFQRPLDRAAIGTFPVVDGRVIGSVVAIAPENQFYTAEHGELFSLLKSPFGVAIENAIQHLELQRLSDLLADDNRYLQRELRAGTAEQIIGADYGLAEVMRSANQVAVHDSPVLILGETGVGKDVIANHIHQVSERLKGPFVKVNCGAIPESLLDSELFGHEKGAFTGALTRKRGRFERAHGGTIFLDEIGELPHQAQVRLLRVLQSKEIERVGGDTTLTVDIRVIAATHRNLEEMVRRGQFREDLWFRLNVFPIMVPPLRVRRDDIPALAQHFIRVKSQTLRYGRALKITGEELHRLTDYDWPGNVRELENVIERALILGAGERLELQHLLRTTTTANVDENINSNFRTLDETLRAHILRVLNHTNGKIHGPDGAAEILNINTSTLRSRMKKLGITPSNR